MGDATNEIVRVSKQLVIATEGRVQLLSVPFNLHGGEKVKKI